MLNLNDLRAAFAAHISADPLRFSMDKALAHVCQMAYQRGLEDGAPKACMPCRNTGAIHCHDPLHCGGPWSTQP